MPPRCPLGDQIDRCIIPHHSTLLFKALLLKVPHFNASLFTKLINNILPVERKQNSDKYDASNHTAFEEKMSLIITKFYYMFIVVL